MTGSISASYLQGVTIPGLVGRSLADVPLAVLAVSGGVDSMALLEAAAESLPPRRLLVATFDHATGVHSARAVELVARRSAELGLPVVIGRRADDGRDTSEASLRDARWEFLRSVAATADGVIVTAHTRDDQVETVLMRIMRGAGARGIAGLQPSDTVRRPLLQLSRADIVAFARRKHIEWHDDPSNASRRYLRNRVRHDVLPAMRAVHPGIDDELLALSARAAEWRRALDDVVDVAVDMRVNGRALDVALATLAGYSRESLAVLWPAMVARVGIALDRRGTMRVVEFSSQGRVGARIQLSGGWEVARGREHLEVRRQRERDIELVPVSLRGRTRFGSWCFEPVVEKEARSPELLSESGSSRDGVADPWMAVLPEDVPLVVRRWRAGDMMTFRTRGPARKVKRFLADAGITGRRRWEWPVVLAGDEIVWIPGICRRHAATGRPGTPARPYRCERHDIHQG